MPKPRHGHRKKPRPPKSKLDQRINGSRKKPTVEELIAEDVIPSVVEVEKSTQRREGRVVSGDQGKLLTDPHRIRSDTQLVGMATRKGWNVKRKNMIRRRMEGIVQKETADVVTKQGVVELHSKADELAIAATKVLVMMDQADMDAEKEATKNPAQPAPNTFIQTNVYGSSPAIDERRIELARLANKFGARTILIDGRSVPVTDILGAVVDVQEVKERTEPEHSPPPDQASP